MRAKDIRDHYEHRIRPTMANYDILDWSSAESQWARFKVLLRVLREREMLGAEGRRTRILDVGCGLTDLFSFLQSEGCTFQYVGVDLTFGILAEALRRYPGRPVFQGDVFDACPLRGGSFGAVFASGIFNLRLGNNAEFAESALPSLAELSSGVVVANFLHRRASYKYDLCYYYDPDTVCGWARRCGRTVEVIDDYLENDFTVVIGEP